jgi:hypothetical protein
MAGIGKEQNPESPKNNYREQRHENRAEATDRPSGNYFAHVMPTSAPQQNAPKQLRHQRSG